MYSRGVETLNRRTESNPEITSNGLDVCLGNISAAPANLSPKDACQTNGSQIIFDASFESANLARVDLVRENEYDLYIRPDTCNPRQRVWFYFSVRNVTRGQKTIFNVVNSSKNKCLHKNGMAPVVTCLKRPNWVRIPPEHVSYSKARGQDGSKIMSFAFEFDEEDTFYFAYCFPYTYSCLQEFICSIQTKQHPCFSRQVLASTVQNRNLDLLTISCPDSHAQRIIFITSRVHPGETPASFVAEGLITFLLSEDPAAKILRKEFIFKIVPMLNPDGVHLGNYRSSLLGFDLNRHWQTPSKWAQPTIFAVKKLLESYHQNPVRSFKNPEVQVLFYIDIHAHTSQLNAFLYGNLFENDSKRCNEQAILPYLLHKLSDDFSISNTQFNTDPVKAGTARRATADLLNVKTLSYTLEVSFFGYSVDNSQDIIPYTEEKYKGLGRNLALALYEYHKLECSGCQLPEFTFYKAESSQNKKLIS